MSTLFHGSVALLLFTPMLTAGPPDPVEADDDRPALEAYHVESHVGHSLSDVDPAPGPYILVFDNMTDADSATGLNVAYLHADAYDSDIAPNAAWWFPMSSDPSHWTSAPVPPATGIPTHILWDEYAVDFDLWGDEDILRTLRRLDFIPVMMNQQDYERPCTLHIHFFNYAGDLWFGGVELTYPIFAGYGIHRYPFGDFPVYAADTVDLAGAGMQMDVASIGWVMFDWREDYSGDAEHGLGMAIAGGDLIDPDFPAPEMQWTLGETDPYLWLAADPETNVDPDWDGDPMTVSYADVLNTGDLYNWAFADPPSDPSSELAHDFPFRLYIAAPALELELRQLHWLADDGSTAQPFSAVGEAELPLSDWDDDDAHQLLDANGGGYVNIAVLAPDGGKRWVVRNLYLSYPDMTTLESSSPTVQFALPVAHGQPIDELQYGVEVTSAPVSEPPEHLLLVGPVTPCDYHAGGFEGGGTGQSSIPDLIGPWAGPFPVSCLSASPTSTGTWANSRPWMRNSTAQRRPPRPDRSTISTRDATAAKTRRSSTAASTLT
jgi:hypothetical protein